MMPGCCEYVCLYVCMCVCMYVCMDVCSMYVCMYVCTHGSYWLMAHVYGNLCFFVSFSGCLECFGMIMIWLFGFIRFFWLPQMLCPQRELIGFTVQGAFRRSGTHNPFLYGQRPKRCVCMYACILYCIV